MTFRSGRAGFARAATAMALAAGIAATISVQGAAASGAAHNLHTRDLKTATSTSPLVYQGGPLLPSSHIYVIWWGNTSAWSSKVQPGIAQLMGDFNGSSYLNIAAQYMTPKSIQSSLTGTASDGGAPPSKVSPSTLGNEVTRLLGQGKLGGTVDPNGIYFVYTSNFPRGGNFCAWHSLATVTGTKVAVAYMPNTTGISGCNPGTFSGTTTDEGLASLANVTAHEFMESVTDPQPTNGSYGWIDSSGSEIGDKCAWQFLNAVTFGDGSSWKLQEEWSNAAPGCVQG